MLSYLHMSNKTIINHFSKHGIIRIMEVDALNALLAKFSEVFNGSEVQTNYASLEEVNYNKIEEVVMHLDSTDPDSATARLGDTLDNISAIHEHWTYSQSEIEQLDAQYRKYLDQSINSASSLSTIVALCLHDDESLEQRISLILARLTAIEKKSYHDYPWNYGDTQHDTESEAQENSGFYVPEMDVIQSRVDQCVEAINNAFAERNHPSRCRIRPFTPKEDGQFWVVVEQGGKSLSIEVLSDDGEGKTETYLPLIRNVVMLDTKHRILRVNSPCEWQDKLYLKQFSYLFFGREDAFVDKPVFTFEPLKRLSLHDAFPINHAAKIRSVEVTQIECGLEINGRQHFVHLKTKSDVSDSWDKFKPLIDTIYTVVLIIKIDEIKNPVTVRIKGKRGLSVSKNSYTEYVRDWLFRLGFGLNITVEVDPECEDEQALEAENNARAFWKQVHAIWLKGTMSMNDLCRMYSPRVKNFMGQFMNRTNDEAVSSKWTDSSGRIWDVYRGNDGKYYAYDAETQSYPAKDAPKIPYNDVELRTLDKKKLAKTLQTALIGDSSTGESLRDTQTGMYWLGHYYPMRIKLYLHISGDTKDHGYRYVLQGNRDPQGTLCFVSFDDDVPEECKSELEARNIQFCSIWALLDVDGKSVCREVDLNENFDMPPAADPAGWTSRWPGAYPKSPSFHHLDLSLKGGRLYIKFVESMLDFEVARMSIFASTNANEEHNANLTNLARLIAFDNKNPNGWLLKEMETAIGLTPSSLSTLSKALRLYFGIQEQFYEPMPGQTGQRGLRYRLAFGRITGFEAALKP